MSATRERRYERRVSPVTGKSWTQLGGAFRPSASGISRFSGTAAHANQTAAELPSWHPAVIEGRPLFSLSTRDVETSPRLLISGFNSAKIGSIVRKSAWRGMPIYTFSLEERATCPRECELWLSCYGNAMPYARRHRYSPALVERLGDELRAMAVAHKRGFVVRLHVLGDFPDLAYAMAWVKWLGQIPQLHVFGYTARRADSDIGRLISAAGALCPERWAVRFSVPPDSDPMPMQATTIWRQPSGSAVPEGTVCPAQQHKTQACSTCGLCWSPAFAGKRIVFIGHGMRGRRKA